MQRATSQRYRRLDLLPDAAAYVDGTGIVRTANDAFRDLWQMCGAGMNSIDGGSLLQVIDPDHREWARAILAVPRVLPPSAARQVKLTGGNGLVAEFVPVVRRSEPCTTWLVILRPAIAAPAGRTASAAPFVAA